MKTIRVITLPGGRSVTLGEYVRSWKALQRLPPQTEVKGWTWYLESAGQILRAMSDGVHDRINRHLPWYPKLWPSRFAFARTQRHLDRQFARGFIHHECRWCGTPMTERKPHDDRFCEPSCKRSYYG